MTALRKPVQKQDAFTQAVREWLSGEVTGHLGNYMYTVDSDDHRWKDGHSADTYYLGRDDKASFDLMVKDIGITATNLFDLGPGGEAAVRAKPIPLMQAVQAKTYIPIDLSPTLANAAAEIVSKTLSVKSEPIVTDFFKEFPISKAKSLLAFMGGTVGNIPTHLDPHNLKQCLVEIFSHHRKAVKNDGHFLVSFDANTNVQEILSCYQNEQFGGLVRSCVERAIDTSNFDYDVTWNAENYQLATGLRSKQDQIVKFEGEEFAIEKGEFLPVLNSYRYPVDFIKEAAQEAGWKHQKTWSATGRVHYLLFSCG